MDNDNAEKLNNISDPENELSKNIEVPELKAGTPERIKNEMTETTDSAIQDAKKFIHPDDPKEESAFKDFDTGINDLVNKTKAEIDGLEAKENSEVNYRENVDRHRGSISEYLNDKMFNDLPEEYKEEYKTILNGYFNKLQNYPIEPDCKFTLVLPAYREERVILETLESLQNQESVKPDEYEVILVNNYPAGKKPVLNDYDESGKKIGHHEDSTADIADGFAESSNLKLHVIEQDFPDKIAGVGIASKLGMDLALMRQKDNPQIIGYYGADTIFDKGWVKGVLDGFKEGGVDGVRGSAKTGPLDNRVEDEHGLHVLSKNELNKILELEENRYKYQQKTLQLENIFKEAKGESSRQITGLPTISAGMYAKIGGMKAFSAKNNKAVTSGEDWRIAQDVAEAGKIFWNKNMLTQTLPRIEKPRADGGSFTGSMWKMFRAYYYGEGDILDKNKNTIVDDPEALLVENELTDSFKRTFFGKGDNETDRKLLEIFHQNELEQLKETMKNYNDWDEFLKNIPEPIIAEVKKRFGERFGKMKLEDAEEKLDKLIKERNNL